MENKHTQGPWVEHDDLTIRDREGIKIAKINASFNHIVKYKELPEMADKIAEEVLANSRLIAAAPDLLEACETFVKWNEREEQGFDQFDQDTLEGQRAFREWFDENARLIELAERRALNAIAKAKGETE